MAYPLPRHSYATTEATVPEHDTYGLHKREWNFRYKMIKGKIAETLVEQLFLSHKYNVYRYGTSFKNNHLATQLTAKPDFVVQHRIDKETYFVEVKFRADGCFCDSDLEKDIYENTLIIVVSKRQIKCLSVRELKQGQQITETSGNYLADRAEFDLRKDVVTDFCDFARTFFESV